MIFLRFLTKKVTVSPNVRSSATATALQIPLMPRSSGRRSTAASWNTSVRRKEIAADISPLFNAVKTKNRKY